MMAICPEILRMSDSYTENCAGFIQGGEQPFIALCPTIPLNINKSAKTMARESCFCVLAVSVRWMNNNKRDNCQVINYFGLGYPETMRGRGSICV